MSSYVEKFHQFLVVFVKKNKINYQIPTGILIHVLSITKCNNKIRSLQSCSTWTQSKRKPEGIPRLIDCSSTFKVCALSNVNMTEIKESNDKLHLKSRY